MQHYLFVLLFNLFTISIFAQSKDTRAELNIIGRVNEISISPDEKIWLVTATGNIYFTDNINANWQYGKVLHKENDKYDLDYPHLNSISFFNNDTAIITGYISLIKGDAQKNGYYLTKDGGKTWKIFDFGGNAWIYDVFIGDNGKAWMGGSSGKIHYSNNFGQSWQTLRSPFTDLLRMNSIFMLNDNEGIAGALHNDIYTTKDNWKTSTKIETPFDQKKNITSEDEDRYADDRIEKIRIWNNYFIVNQAKQIFYSEINKIDWKPFPINIINFEIDNRSKKLFAITKDLKAVSFSTPELYSYVNNAPIHKYPFDIKAINNSLYAISYDNEITKLNATENIHIIPYTVEHIIPQPKLVKQNKKLTWGITGKQIYLSDNKGKSWYRENVIDFNVDDFAILNDSAIILWDGAKNYLYELAKHDLVLYNPERPIEDFLKEPLTYFKINAGTRGCFHFNSNTVEYVRSNDSMFNTIDILTKSNGMFRPNDEDTTAHYKNTINGNRLLEILHSINSKPALMPSIKDFNITEENKKDYLELIDSLIKTEDRENSIKETDKDFYYSIPARLNNIDDSVITKIFEKTENGWSTTLNWFTVEFFNANNDTVEISKNYYISTLPWNLPWTVTYKGQYFTCNDIRLSKYINECIPDSFMYKSIFDNKFLILQIARYFKEQKLF